MQCYKFVLAFEESVASGGSLQLSIFHIFSPCFMRGWWKFPYTFWSLFMQLDKVEIHIALTF